MVKPLDLPALGMEAITAVQPHPSAADTVQNSNAPCILSRARFGLGTGEVEKSKMCPCFEISVWWGQKLSEQMGDSAAHITGNSSTCWDTLQ